MENIVQELLKEIASSLNFLKPAMLSLAILFIIIDLTLHYLFNHEAIFITLTKKVLLYGFFLWILMDYDNIILKTFLNGAIEIGNKMVGIDSIKLLVSPLFFFFKLIAISSPALAIGTTGAILMDTIMELESLPTFLMFLVGGMFLAALLLSYQIAMLLIEYYTIAVYAIILLPFGLYKKTRFLAEKALGAIFGQAIKIMAMTMLLNFFDKYWKKYIEALIKAGINPLKWQTVLAIIAVLIIFWGTLKRVPTIVHALLAGSASSGHGGNFVGGIAGASFSNGVNILRHDYNEAGGFKGIYESFKNHGSDYEEANKK